MAMKTITERVWGAVIDRARNAGLSQETAERVADSLLDRIMEATVQQFEHDVEDLIQRQVVRQSDNEILARTPPLAAYRLPDGSIVQVDDTAARGAPVIGFTLRGGMVVDATRVDQPKWAARFSKDEVNGFRPFGNR